MALLKILTAPDPRLKEISKPVETVDDELRQLMEDMLETMYDAPGIGLAAPQVGVLKRILVIDLARDGQKRNPMKFINPEVVWISDHDASYEEGCLSVPGHYADVPRPAECKVKYMDENNQSHEIHATGLLATCLQHEIDHLDGILFIDHLTALKRNVIMRKLLKVKKEEERAAEKAHATIM